MERKALGFAESSKQPVPPSDVAIIEFVNIEFVMDGVMLGALEKIADPTRSANVAVIEVLAERGKNIEPEGALDGRTERDVEQSASDQGIGCNLQRMFVKGSKEFDSARTVMNLVTDSPEKVGIVACAMPPIEDKRPNKPAEQTF